MAALFKRQHYAVSPSPNVGISVFAPMMLFLIVLIIGVGPRIPLGFIDAEIRVQDILIFPIMLYLLLSPSPQEKHPLRRLIGTALPVFLWASFVTVLLSIFVFPEISLLRRVAYFGRTVEMIFLAIVIAGLYLRSGHNALRVILNGVTIGALLNLCWFAYQVAVGEPTTLFGGVFGSQVEAYGPRLIGEPSAFGVGQYWTFVAAIAAARIKGGIRVWFSTLLFAAALWASWMAESRISMGSILVLGGLVLILGRDRKRPIHILGTISGIIITIFGASQILPVLGGRLSPDAIHASFQIRLRDIWQPNISAIIDSPLIGIGPGGLLGIGNQSEAHNIIIRAMLDFGIVVGPLFLTLFLIAMMRGFRLARSTQVDPITRTAGYIGAFSILGTLISGQVQDALTAVMPSHLTMVAIGVLAAQSLLWRNNIELSKNDHQQEATCEPADVKNWGSPQVVDM